MSDPLDSLISGSQGNTKPLDNMQRIILQNLFDTQPKRREAYLKKLGYEMNPKDDNQYRPIGSTGDYAEVDPGFVKEFQRGWIANSGKGIIAQVLGGRQAVKDEAAMKAVGAAFSTLVSAPLVAGGAAVEGAPALAGGPLAIPAAILGGAAGNAAAEGVKKMAGDVLLHSDVPVDKSGLVMQSLMTGIAGPLFKGAVKLGKEGIGTFLEARKNAIINAAKQSGGGLTEDIINKAVKDPEMFSRKSVDGANEKLKQTFKNIFGIEDPLKLDAPERINGGAFGKKMDVLNAQANSEVDRLSKEKAANVSVDEITAPLKKLADEINGKFSKTADEKAAYSYLKDRIAEVESKAGASESTRTTGILDQYGKPIKETTATPQKTLSYKDAREFMNSIQSDLSQKDTAGNYLNPAGRVASSAINGDTGVLAVLNKKAESVGSNLPQINAERSRVLQAYNTATDVLTPKNITNAFVGNDSPTKALIRDAAGEIDNILGSDFSKTIEDGSMQRAVENMYKNPKAFGSGRTNAEMTKGAVMGAAKGAAVGAGAGLAVGGKSGAGMGAIVGGAGGALKGAYESSVMQSPERALGEISNISSQLQNVDNFKLPSSVEIPATVGAQDVARNASVSTPDQQQQKTQDPLDALLNQ